ncbi:hypothetical protein HAX54_010816, partial [Datura stramonium]|nr:hypothetical protein [Datura stramonium]
AYVLKIKDTQKNSPCLDGSVDMTAYMPFVIMGQIIKTSVGVMEDVLVKFGKFVHPADIVLLDYDID